MHPKGHQHQHTSKQNNRIHGTKRRWQIQFTSSIMWQKKTKKRTDHLQRRQPKLRKKPKNRYPIPKQCLIATPNRI